MNMQDTLNKIGYGLYVLTAKEGSKDNGCIINAVMQVTNQPAQIAVSVNKMNYTHDMIMHTGMFNISVLTEDTPFKVFQHFGFQSGRSMNKFEDCPSEHRTLNGILYIPKYTNGVISGKVRQTIDVGSHTIFLASVEETVNLSAEASLSYAYYHQHIKPKPQPAEKSGWRCKVCGYVYEGDELPSDFICPWCKHSAEDFERITNNNNQQINNQNSKKMKFICKVCGYVHEGDAAPEKCPQCGQPADKFEMVKEDAALTFATEHVIGVAQSSDDEMRKDLNAHFMGEATEVGMYLAMSRQADREGYPEVAEAFKRYAFEEAEHCAKFAELLGDVVWDTKTNLEKRMMAESGACADKMRIAKRAKEMNWDAIHDTVHEMAKDEARHGQGFQGLFNRYFKK